MMKALYLYSDKSGKNKSIKRHNYIVKRLSEKYDVTSFCSSSLEEFNEQVIHCKEKYDVLLVAGGDGTFNRLVNALGPLEKENRPIVGYIPTGTINDAGKSLGIKGNINQALKVILDGYTCDIDIGKVNESYFIFVLAVGQYSDIAYITKRDKKKKFGRLAYYFLALKEAFKIRKIKATLICDGTKYEVTTPFVLIMNSVHVGGFPVNFKNSIRDGKFDIYLTKPGLFNGLLHFLFFKVKTKHIRCTNLEVETNTNDPWCVDGEKGESGKLQIKCLKENLKIFADERYIRHQKN